uniref:Uncharacterized protein n=1 Tax=Arundo donax TaxID=35708 RepID=A0A0A9AZR4_ARUDO
MTEKLMIGTSFCPEGGAPLSLYSLYCEWGYMRRSLKEGQSCYWPP